VYNRCAYGNSDRIEFTLTDSKGIPKATNIINVIYQQESISDRFVIDLSNPIIKIPKGLTKGPVEKATEGIAYVYSNN
jgi:hypothetical protein